jgi:enterochelin esterase family protein
MVAMMALRLALGAVPVEFRHRDDQARSVSLVGEMNGWKPGATPMSRGPEGTWTVTVPLEPGQWLYKFHKDGKWIADDGNPLSSPDGQGGRHSYVLVGDGDFRRHDGVAHGRIRAVKIPSRALGADVEANLYVPPSGSTQRPVLVLLHGNNMDRLQWTDNGLIADFMDNLLHQERIEPFVVAMPSIMPHRDKAGLTSFLAVELPRWLAKEHGTRSAHSSLALGGFSMGGGVTLRVAASHPQAYGLWLPLAAAIHEKVFDDFLPKLLRAGPILQYCGRDAEELIAVNRRAAKALKANRRAEYLEVPGGHTLRFLNQVTPDLLQRTSRFFAARLKTPSPAAGPE